MLLTTNNYRQSETEKEPHNLLLDFRGALPPFSDDSPGLLHAQLPFPVGPPLPYPLEQLEITQRPVHNLNAGLLDYVQDIEGAPADYKYLPHKLLEALDAQQPELEPDFELYLPGGCLGALTLQRTLYLVWPQFDGGLKLWSPTGQECNIGDLPPGPVLGLEAYSGPREGLIVLRFKWRVVVLGVVGPPAYRVAFTEGSTAPFLDAQLQDQLLGLIQLRTGFVLRDIASDKTVFTFGASDVRKFAFAPEKCVVLMEPWLVKIVDYEKNALLQRLDPQLIACNQLCCLRMEGQNLLLGSRHYLIGAPLDSLSDFGVFAHGLRSPPVQLEAQGSVVCLGGRRGTAAFVRGSPLGPPIALPSIRDTLHAALPGTSDVLLLPTMLRRLDLATAGLKLVGDVLFSVNCIGEVFQQRLSHSVAVDNATPIQAMIGWAGRLKGQLAPPQLPVTNFAAMGGAFGLLATPLKQEKGRRRGRSLAGQFLARFEPLYGRKRVTSEFGRGFLEAWSDEDSDGDVTAPAESELPFYDKVSSWMQRHDTELPEPH